MVARIFVNFLDHFNGANVVGSLQKFRRVVFRFFLFFYFQAVQNEPAKNTQSPLRINEITLIGVFVSKRWRPHEHLGLKPLLHSNDFQKVRRRRTAKTCGITSAFTPSMWLGTIGSQEFDDSCFFQRLTLIDICCGPPSSH